MFEFRVLFEHTKSEHRKINGITNSPAADKPHHTLTNALSVPLYGATDPCKSEQILSTNHVIPSVYHP